jgi:hypothetical protein
MAFTPGTWMKLPSNCSRTYSLTYQRCAAYGTVSFKACLDWVTNVTTPCIGWATQAVQTCVQWAMQERSIAFGQPVGGRRWWKLTPDGSGSYANGSWSRLADSNQDRLYFASAVLADGRVIVCGGEYSDASGSFSQDDTNTCEIYDPVANSWNTIPAPPSTANPATTWTQIGDSPCTVLPDGTFLMASFTTTDVAKFDPTTNNWSTLSARTVSSASEESFVLMPDK